MLPGEVYNMNFRLKAKRWFGALLKIMGSGTPDSLARGVALGLFVGFFIIFGLQLVVVVPLAWICRANRIAAVTFTFVTNHVTVFFIYPLQCLAGGYIMGDNYSMQALQAKMSGLIHNFTWDNFAGLGGELAVAFMLEDSSSASSPPRKYRKKPRSDTNTESQNETNRKEELYDFD